MQQRNSARLIHPSATGFVYERLRALILRGRFAAGTLLVEQDVAQALHVSRTPVHAALRQLAAEGLIDIEPRRRARVSQVGTREIEQLYAIRAALESLAAEAAARQPQEAVIVRLEKEAVVMEDIARDLSPEKLQEFADANARFHHDILSAAQDRWLHRALQPVLGVLLGPVSAPPSPAAQAIRYDLLVRNLERNNRQHRAIIDALRAREPERASMAMKRHVDTAHREWGVAVERLKRIQNG